uniref:Uncharacterized protein n=1 Tax=viral metagenome TaxID=1070528 RepID=A0A6H1ZCU1_9ZZZZ
MHKITREQQINNLLELRKRKYTKLGQLRAIKQVIFLVQQQKVKELKDLQIIEEDIKNLSE